MTSQELRTKFLEFFRKRGHLVRPGISLVPEDPTLLFTSAGMVPMKPYFLGIEEPPARRMVTIQRCFRTSDIYNVGHTPRHLTFLEMLGNFSVGDYFKEGAIQYAWEFITEEMGVPRERLWVSVFRDDEEAFSIWRNKIDFPTERLVRLGEKDNFWGPVGTTGTGPCGPCSEIYFDLGEGPAPVSRPGDETQRFVEIWNLVFMEFNKDESGILIPLQQKNIDTGMGLERLAMVMQGAKSIFETDLFSPLIASLDKMSLQDEQGVRSRLSAGRAEQTMASHLIADHLRAITFLVADGVIPTNEGRGYVLRRILRRAFRFGRKLKLSEPFLYQLIPQVVEIVKPAYPELQARLAYIQKIVQTEEERFRQTLDEGMELFEQLARTQGEKLLKGEQVFKLYDTYGFPLELTQELAEERGLKVDEEGFRVEMEKQRQRARVALRKVGMEASPTAALREEKGACLFVGYELEEVDTAVLAILRQGKEILSLSTGEEGEVFLEQTPFYGEKGGQIGDQGSLLWEQGEAEVLDTQSPLDGVILHRVKVSRGNLSTGIVVEARVDHARRAAIARAHTATHLLHRVIRRIIGEHASQAGSLVEPDRLRFDFSHFQGIEPENLRRIEEEVNALMRENLPVKTQNLSLEDAKTSGAIALFTDKYKDSVRIVEAGQSKELCGGTHVRRTGDIGYFLILEETGVGSNLRRIEALTGELAVKRGLEERAVLAGVAEILHAPPLKAEGKLVKIMQEEAEGKKKAFSFRERYLHALGVSLEPDASISEFPSVIAQLEDLDLEALTLLSDFVLERMGQGLVILGSIWEEKPLLLVRLSRDLIKKGMHAGNLAKQLGEILGGSGGGKPEMGRAGGKEASLLPLTLTKVKELIRTENSGS